MREEYIVQKDAVTRKINITNKVPINITLEENIELPTYATENSSGVDIRAKVDLKINSGQTKVIPTGIKVAIPEGFEIQIRGRSGLAAKHGLMIANAPGTIDADYRGEIGVIIHNSGGDFFVKKGERIAQMVLCPVYQMKFRVVKELDETKRGSGGFGSTGII